MVKTCNSCNNILSISFFYRSSKGYLDSLCKKCRKEYSKKWKKENPKKNKKHHQTRFKKDCENLTDFYVVNHLINDKQKIIDYSNSEKHKDLISLYRENVKLKRELNKWKSTKNT